MSAGAAAGRRCFNTQPPEGGWPSAPFLTAPAGCFNTQPPEGGWDGRRTILPKWQVSTHSRLKAAGNCVNITGFEIDVSTHSRLKAAGYDKYKTAVLKAVSTHSRLKAAGSTSMEATRRARFQHTAA